MCHRSAVVTTRDRACHIFRVLTPGVYVQRAFNDLIFIRPTVSLNETVLRINRVISNEGQELLHMAFLWFLCFALYTYLFFLRRHATYINFGYSAIFFTALLYRFYPAL